MGKVTDIQRRSTSSRGTGSKGVPKKYTFKIILSKEDLEKGSDLFAHMVFDRLPLPVKIEYNSGGYIRAQIQANSSKIKDGATKLRDGRLEFTIVITADSKNDFAAINFPEAEEARSREIQKDKEEKEESDRKVQSLKHHINMQAHFIQEDIKMIQKGSVHIEYLGGNKFKHKAVAFQEKGSFSFIFSDEKLKKAELDLIKKSLWDATNDTLFKTSDIIISNLEEELDQFDEAFDFFHENSDNDSVDYLELMKDLLLPTKEDLLLLLLGGGIIKVLKSGHKLFRWIKRSKKVSSAISKSTRAARKIYTKLLKQNKLREIFIIASDIMRLSYSIVLKFIRDKELIKKTFHEITSNILVGKSSNVSNTAGKVFSKEVIGEMLNQHVFFAKPNEKQEKELVKAGFAMVMFKPEFSKKLARGFIHQAFIFRSTQNILTLYAEKISNNTSIVISEKDIKILIETTIMNVFSDILKVFIGDSKDIHAELIGNATNIAMKTWVKTGS